MREESVVVRFDVTSGVDRTREIEAYAERVEALELAEHEATFDFAGAEKTLLFTVGEVSQAHLERVVARLTELLAEAGLSAVGTAAVAEHDDSEWEDEAGEEDDEEE